MNHRSSAHRSVTTLLSNASMLAIGATEPSALVVGSSIASMPRRSARSTMSATRTTITLLALSLGGAAVAGTVTPPHLDLWLHPEAGAMAVGSITEGTPGTPVDPVARVFGADLGEDPAFPSSAPEPGFQALPGRATAGASFSFELPGGLLVWDGAALVPSDHVMTLAYGPASVVSSAGWVDGFAFTAQPSGLMHIHFDYTLSGPVGDPEPGVYALPIAFDGVAPPLAPSPTCWIVFNLGQDEATHDAAMAYAEWSLACAPDLSGDGAVDAADVAILLGAWGGGDPAADLDGSGTVDAADLGELLGAWGLVCPR